MVSWTGKSQVHHKDMDKVPGKNPPGTFQAHSEFSQPVSLQCSWVRKWLVHSQCSRSCDQGVPIRNIMGTFKVFPKKVPRIFLSGSFRISFAISPAVGLQCSWVRKWSVHLQFPRSCDQSVPISAITVFPVSKTQNKPEQWP